MKANHIRQNVFPIITAFIWGTTFVTQSKATEFVGPFTFNASRALLAFLFLLGLWRLLDARRRRDFAGQAQPSAGSRKDLLLGGFCTGFAMTAAAFFQQKGLETTASGKAGFITAMYIVLVPVFGIFLKKKAPKLIWASVALAVVGLYFLCIQEDVVPGIGDAYVLIGAVGFTFHILLIDHYTQKVDGVALSCMQFLTMFLLSSVGVAMTETVTVGALVNCAWPIVYAGIFSSGIAYTLQILAQKDSNPTVVALLLSLESVFAVIADALIMNHWMSGRETLGCLLVLAAVVLVQLPVPQKKRVLTTAKKAE